MSRPGPALLSAVVATTLAWLAVCPGLAQPAEPAVVLPPAGGPEESGGDALPSLASPVPPTTAVPAGPPATEEGAGGVAEPAFEMEPGYEGSVVEVGPPLPAAGVDEEQEPGDVPAEAHIVRYYLERFEVRGNQRTRATTVVRWMLLRPGEAFRADDPRIEESKVALLATGFFEDVRFSLERGSRRGWVVFIIHVRERWTLLIENLAFGYTTVTPFGGLGIAELNLFGTGSQLAAAFVAGKEQQAYRLRFTDPSFLGSDWSLTAGAQVCDAQDYLGFNGVRSVRADGTVETDHATIDYWRAGGYLGTGYRISDRMRADVSYRFEWIDAELPVAASYRRGRSAAQTNAPVPLDLLPGQSLLSGLQVSFSYDSRDDPFLPTSGTRLRATADLSHGILGSDYPFAKFTVDWAKHFLLSWGHTLTLGAFAGVIIGSAPLFDQFFVGDLSDLIPGRVLELNFHDYPSLDLLGTAIAEMQYEDLAAKVGVEYAWPAYRSRSGFLYGLDVFVAIGFFSLASASDVAMQIPGYSGASVFPIDLTGDLGVRFDTMIGLFRVSFSNVMGLIPQVD